MNTYLRQIQGNLGKFYIPAITLLMTLIIFALGYFQVRPQSLSIGINQVADQTIQSPITIEDTEQTELNRERARSNTPDVYAFNEDIRTEQIRLVDEYFEQIFMMRDQEYTGEDLSELVSNSDLRTQVRFQTLSEERQPDQQIPFGQLNEDEQTLVYQGHFRQLGDPLEAIAIDIPSDAVRLLIGQSVEELSAIRTQLNEILNSILAEEIQANELNRYVNESFDFVEAQSLGVDSKLILNQLLSEFIVPTSVYSEEETARRREEAAAAVSPSYILQGQVIVQEGHIINENVIRQLELVGLTGGDVNLDSVYIFLLILIFHLIGINYLASKSEDSLKIKQNEMTAYTLIVSIGFLFMNVFSFLQASGIDYVMLVFPIFFTHMLAVERLPRRLLLTFLVAFHVLSLFVFHDGQSITESFITQAYYLYVIGFTGFYYLTRGNFDNLKEILITGLLGNVFFTLLVLALLSIPLVSELSIIVFGMTSLSLVSSLILYFFIEPYWSALLDTDAPLTLNELSNLNHPLLTLLIEKAPGSYHHSIMVASLAAQAAEVIGANSLLAKVASYYHDVGKTVHPLFFVENLSEGRESPHGVITAEESAQIIIGHVSEGQKILESHKMPQSIIDICNEHHGTTMVKYFYHQAQQDSNHSVEPKLFTYPGPKPQTKESVIIMIADSLEAACRSLKSYSQESLEGMVNNIIQGKINDGQLSDSDITVHELQLIKASFIKTLASMYHTRIEYPEEKVKV